VTPEPFPPHATPPDPPAAERTQMFREAGEAPAVTARQRLANAPVVADLAARLRRAPPRAVVTCARGSSDHAATYARYLIETRLGTVTASAAPSVSSVYEASPDMRGMLCLAISQSGRSPDLLAWARAAASAGGLVVAMVNDETSPLAQEADLVLPLGAGPETSVAATKSYIAALAAACQLVAAWSGDEALDKALQGLPALLAKAWALPWDAAATRLACANGLYVIGRGLGFAVAQEAALKFKETCGLHAEAFSSAEVRHGPMALVGPGFPVLAFAQEDETRPDVDAAAASCAAQGAVVVKAGGEDLPGVCALPVAEAHPVLQPIAFIQSFYRMACGLAVARGIDPDRPPHLRKVTETF
jgi:glucosamine--fructose-6-phosphate aminotransferase (isomerizing)